MESFYSDAASFGKISAYISAFFAVLLGIGMIYLGFAAIRNAKQIMQLSRPGDHAPILIARNGKFLVGFGVAVIILALVWAFLATKYKFVAAAVGIRSVADIFA
jgi:hypothetical protein